MKLNKLGIVLPREKRMVSAAPEKWSFEAKMSGDGLGGCVIALVGEKKVRQRP